MTPEQYFSSPGVSNSALNQLQRELHPQSRIILSDDPLRFGKLFESRVQDIPSVYSKNITEYGQAGERERIERMYAALSRDKWAMTVMMSFQKQVAVFNPVTLTHNGIRFTVDGKCLFDWFLRGAYGGDLKTFSGGNFDAACHRFEWIESRVWYMLVARTHKDFLIGVSKENSPKVATKFIIKGSDEYNAALENVRRKAYEYYMLKY